MNDPIRIGKPISAARPISEDDGMNAHADDRQLFERFCILRDLYRQRGRRDRAAIMSIEDAMRYAELLLARSAASTV